MDTPIIDVKGLVKDYGETRAVDHLNLDLKKGEIFGLLGPNGAGKTTIILSLLGLTEPDAGSAMVKGFNATSQPLKVKKITGYLPDEVGFSGNRTGFESLVYTALLNGIPQNKASVSARELLKTVGLEEAGYHKTKTYSKGMTQRLGLADVLIKEPEIMILDEPTIGIDPKGINEFLDMIRNLSKEKDITVLLSSHLLQQVQKICDRVGILVDGSLQAVGDIDQLANSLFEDKDLTIRAELAPITDALVRDLQQEPCVQTIESNGEVMTVKGTKDAAPLISKKVIHSGGELYKLSYETYGLDEIYQHFFERGGNHG